MRFQLTCRPALLGVVVLAFAISAYAQRPAADFGQLGVLVYTGDRVTVTGSSGGVVEGRILDLSPSKLTIKVDGQPRQFLLDDVRTISRQQHASIGKGAAWGFGIGAGLGLWTYASVARCCGGLIFAGTVLTGAMGAGIGAGFAAATMTDHVVFAKPGTGNVKLSAGPIIGRNNAGVMLTAQW